MELLIASASCAPLSAAAVRTGASGGAPAIAHLSIRSRAPSGVAFTKTTVASPGGVSSVSLSHRCRCTTGNYGQSPSQDLEHFLEKMKKFKESRPTTPTVTNRSHDTHTVVVVIDIAKMCPVLLEELLRKYNPHPLPAKTLKEVCGMGIWFMELEDRCSISGHVSDDSIEEAIKKFIRIMDIFPRDLIKKIYPENFKRLTPVARLGITYNEHVVYGYRRIEL